MSTLRINIILFGIGNVGSTLIQQVLESQQFFLEKRNIDLRFPIITNSTVAFFEKDGLKNQWEANFQQAAIPFQIQDVFDYVQEHQLDHLIAVDATASSEIIQHYISLIENGFHLVAANKKANASSIDFYQKLRQKLSINQSCFHYETNVGAGLPVVQIIKELYLSGEKITKIRGVFSGSLSYIFNRFGQENIPFSSVLADAEKNGLTEPDSREDLSGNDVARKLLILAREIGIQKEFSEVQISSLLLPNLNQENTKAEYASNKQLLDKPYEIAKITQAENHVLRYVGELDVANQKLDVKLISVPKNAALGQLNGADNLIEIYTHSYGEIPLVIQGAGAGKQVTARGVLSDILKITEKIKLKESIFIN
jgi:homoserine dehydrogenase